MVKLVAFPRGKLRSINLNVFHSISSSKVSYRSGLSSAGVLMSEVIVPLIKRGGQVEKKSAQVLTLGGRGRAGAGTAERGWREILQEVNWKLIEKLGGLKTKVDDEKLESVLRVN